MPRTPNYNFERKERERLKAEKKAKRLAAKQDARDKKSDPTEPSVESSDQNTDLARGE